MKSKRDASRQRVNLQLKVRLRARTLHLQSQLGMLVARALLDTAERALERLLERWRGWWPRRIFQRGGWRYEDARCMEALLACDERRL